MDDLFNWDGLDPDVERLEMVEDGFPLELDDF
jgi:hypothetical protein